MIRFLLVTVFLAAPLLRLSGEDKNANHALTYTSPRKNFAAVTIRVADSPTGAVGRVSAVSFARGTERSLPIRITRAQFEDMWSKFLSSGILQYAVKKNQRPIHMDAYYLFVADGNTYAVPKNLASSAAASLAKQMEAYANENSVALQNQPEHGIIVR